MKGGRDKVNYRSNGFKRLRVNNVKKPVGLIKPAEIISHQMKTLTSGTLDQHHSSVIGLLRELFSISCSAHLARVHHVESTTQ